MTFLWVFLPIVLIGNLLIFKGLGTRVSNIFLLLASLLFYAWGEPFYILLMLVSICLNFAGGLLITKFHNRGVLALVVAANLGLLGVFKYLDMIIGTVNTIGGLNFTLPGLMLPLGISFYTFQALSYVIDVYRGQCEPQKSLFKLALYISFFPQLIAGPIVKYKDVNDQINDRVITLKGFSYGIGRFIYGLGKKVLLSNVLAKFVDAIFATDPNELNTITIWFAAAMFSLQIYYDFSGYSDMAIGLGKMCGFDFKENFIYPFTCRSIREHWQRWHISLGGWFREYLYFPLGGSRKGPTRAAINLLIVFFLVGLWHGASYNFVLWGVYYGAFQVLEKSPLGKFLEKSHVISRIYVFAVITCAVIIFKNENLLNCGIFFERMFIPTMEGISIFTYMNGHTIFVLIFSILAMGFIQRPLLGTPIHKKWKGSIPETIVLCGILALCIMTLASDTYNPFIYFRF